MKALNHPQIKLMAGIAALAVMASSVITPVLASKTLANLEQPIVVELKTALDSKTAAKGTPFEAVSTEDYTYLGGIIPAGTHFKGHVEEAKPSRVFARPGYVMLKVDEAIMPTGEIYQMVATPGHASDSGKLINPKAHTFGKNVAENAPLAATSAATSIPLQAATDLNSAIIFPIALGARMITGAATEVISKDDEGRSLPAQIGYGMWRGTGIPGVVGFFKKPDEAKLNPGDNVVLRIDPASLKGLFLVKSQGEYAPKAEVTPESSDVKSTGLVPEVKQPESAQQNPEAIP